MRERGLSAEATRARKVLLLSEVGRLAKDAQVALRGSGMEGAWLHCAWLLVPYNQAPPPHPLSHPTLCSKEREQVMGVVDTS